MAALTLVIFNAISFSQRSHLIAKSGGSQEQLLACLKPLPATAYLHSCSHFQSVEGHTLNPTTQRLHKGDGGRSGWDFRASKVHFSKNQQ